LEVVIPVIGGTRMFLYRGPADMRKGFDGLAGMVEDHFSENLFTGALFIFLNRRRDRVKILYWDRDGLALWHKRLERGRFLMPVEKEGASAELTTAELSMLLEGITPLRVNRRYRLGEEAATG
jgi:transposase